MFVLAFFLFTGLDRSVKYIKNAMNLEQSHHARLVEEVIHTRGKVFINVS